MHTFEWKSINLNLSFLSRTQIDDFQYVFQHNIWYENIYRFHSIMENKSQKNVLYNEFHYLLTLVELNAHTNAHTNSNVSGNPACVTSIVLVIMITHTHTRLEIESNLMIAQRKTRNPPLSTDVCRTNINWFEQNLPTCCRWTMYNLHAKEPFSLSSLARWLFAWRTI